MKDVLTGRWCRVLSMAAPEAPGTAEEDYAAVRPAALAAATAGRPLVVAWLSRGDGADLELITVASSPAPVRRGKHAAPSPGVPSPGVPSPGARGPAGGPGEEPPLLFPPGAQAEPADGSLADLDRLVWAPCLALPETPPETPPEAPAEAAAQGRPEAPPPAPAELDGGPGVFETALVALMRRPFGWLVVAEPTDLLAAETAGLRTELEILRRHHERRADRAVEQTERRLAERGTFGAAGLWRVRVLAGASSPAELDVLAPLLAGAAELDPHPYRLRHTTGARSLDAALAARHHDPADGAQSPFFVTAGTLTALAGLPRVGVPGLALTHPADPGSGPGRRQLSELQAGAHELQTSEPEARGPGAHELQGRLLPAPVAAPEASDTREVLETVVVLETAVPAESLETPEVPETPEDLQAGPSDRADPTDLETLAEISQGPADRSAPELPPGSEDRSVPPLPMAGPAPEADPDPDVTGTVEDFPAEPGTPATERSIRSAKPHVPDDPAPDVATRMVELGAPADPDGESVQVPMGRLRDGVLVAGSAGSGAARTVRQLLAQATAAGLPWLLVDPAGTEYRGLPATVLSPVDPDAPPLTLSPLTPSPGYPLQAHLALVGALFDLALGADETMSLIVAQALRQAYRAAGWDLVTGRPGAPVQPPGLGDLHTALRELIGRSGFDRPTRARLRGTADARFGSWQDGPAGRFLAGGHPAGPADLSELLRRRVVLATRDLADADRALVTGTLLIRLAEHLRARPPTAGNQDGPELRHLLVLAEARTLLRDDGDGQPGARAAERFAALIPELAAAGTGTVLTERRPALLTPDAIRDPALRIVHRLPAPADRDAMGVAPSAAPTGADTAIVLTDGTAQPVKAPPAEASPLAREPEPGWSPRGRRSPACGQSCRTERPCRLAELRGAERLAESPDQAWLRVWGEILTLAFLTDNPLPAVPAPLRRRWRGQTSRARECLLGHVIGDAAGRRAGALRGHYDPAQLAGVLAAAATSRLGQTGSAAVATVRPGPAWVIPPLRWLHEVERLCPLGGAGLAPGDHAPPLDFDLPGLPDWPGIRIGQRIRALRRHPLSMELAANRQLAWTALVGEPGPEPFAGDLAQVLPGVDSAQALRHTAGLLEISGGVSGGPGWLEVVLSWPRRFVAFSGDRSRPGHAADGLTG
ncbi:MAG TPA: hypothetical protein VG268_20545 [Streptosporangiaceae bacterium]|nr:hypothetical protein [Streptosporangiaceae bacterium]